jgi:hypothetical protein
MSLSRRVLSWVYSAATSGSGRSTLSDRLRDRGGLATEAIRVRAFGTLPGRVKRGERRFTVEWHRAEDPLFYKVFAFARPLARVGPPFEQLVRRRFAAASLRAMAAAHHGTFQFPGGFCHPL